MARIDTSRIEGYADMTAEEKLAALEALEYEDNLGELERMRAAVTKANAEAADWKRKHGALLGDDEKKRQEAAEKLANMEEELAALRKEKTVSEYTANLVAQGYSKELAAETANAFADGDHTKVFANMQKFMSEHDKAMKAELLKGTPTPPSGKTPKPMTREEIMKIEDPTERQQAIGEHIELFRKEE